MRSSKSAIERTRRAADPLAPGPNGFAHRGRHGPAPLVENSLAAFAAALDMGAGIECDVRLTRDGALVVFHDANTARLCGKSRDVAASTLSDLRTLEVGGRPIPTLAELLALVDGRAPILIEAKRDGRRGTYCRALGQALAGYGGRYGLMSFDPMLVAWMRRKVPGARVGLVVADRLGRFRRWFAMRIAKPRFLSVETHSLGRPWVARARQSTPVYSWTVRTTAQRRFLAPLADALIWESDGRP